MKRPSAGRSRANSLHKCKKGGAGSGWQFSLGKLFLFPWMGGGGFNSRHFHDKLFFFKE